MLFFSSDWGHLFGSKHCALLVQRKVHFKTKFFLHLSVFKVHNLNVLKVKQSNPKPKMKILATKISKDIWMNIDLLNT